MLKSVSIENFKALKSVDIALEPFTVLVGKNASGKTSVLQALLEGVERSWLPDLRLLTRPDATHCRIRLMTTTGHEHVIQSDPPEAREERARHLQIDDEARPPAISASFLRLDPRAMIRDSVTTSEEPTLDADGSGLASVLSYLGGAHPEIVEAIGADLATIVPRVRKVRSFPTLVKRHYTEKVTIGDQALHPTLERTEPGHRFALDMGYGKLIEADLLSEGTVLALGLLTALHHPKCPTLLLLDDIDGALHTTAQVELMKCLRQIQEQRNDVQLVCTTHSPYLLDELRLEEVRVMALGEDGYARCRKLADHPKSGEWRKMLQTGEFWASVGEDWILGSSSDA